VVRDDGLAVIPLRFLDVALAVLGWFVSLFDALPALDLPGGLSLTLPIPFLDAGEASSFESWVSVAVLVASALVVGKVLQWLYALIPFKMT
jgi:hypothetical protein